MWACRAATHECVGTAAVTRECVGTAGVRRPRAQPAQLRCYQPRCHRAVGLPVCAGHQPGHARGGAHAVHLWKGTHLHVGAPTDTATANPYWQPPPVAGQMSAQAGFEHTHTHLGQQSSVCCELLSCPATCCSLRAAHLCAASMRSRTRSPSCSHYSCCPACFCRDMSVSVSRTATISRDTCIGDGSSVGEGSFIQARRGEELAWPCPVRLKGACLALPSV